MLTPTGAPLVHAARRARRRAERRVPRRRHRGRARASASAPASASVVDVSLLGAAVWTLGDRPRRRLRASGVEAKPHSPGKALSGTVLIGTVSAPADERWLSLNMLDQERHWAPTCRALGLDELIDDPRVRDHRGAQPNVCASCTTSSSPRSASLPLAELKARLAAEDTIFSTMSSPNEVIDDPQVRGQRLHAARTRAIPTARLSSAPMQFDGAGLEIRRRAPDDRRAHRRGVRARSASTPARSHGCASWERWS